MSEERVEKLISKALELQEQGSSQVSSSDLIEISQELQIDIYYSRTGAKDDLHKEVLKDLMSMQELKLPESESKQVTDSGRELELNSVID